MGTDHAPLLEHTIDIAAPVERVWDLVRDPVRMPEWSPGVTSVRLRDGFTDVALGAEFTNRNRLDDMQWITHGTIVRLTENHEMAFRIEEAWVTWSFTLEAIGSGTRLTHRRETPEGISEFSLRATEAHFGGQEAFTAVLDEGMRTTLAAIKTAAEQAG